MSTNVSVRFVEAEVQSIIIAKGDCPGHLLLEQFQLFNQGEFQENQNIYLPFFNAVTLYNTITLCNLNLNVNLKVSCHLWERFDSRALSLICLL